VIKSKGGVCYIVTNNVNDKQYVGKTASDADNAAWASKRRWRQHVTYTKRKGKGALSAAIIKYGEDAFSVVTIGYYDSYDKLTEAEVRYIAQYNTVAPNGYNLTVGGEGALSYRHTDEWKAAKSASMKGVDMSALTKAAVEANTGAKYAPERVAKISAALKGRQLLSDEQMRNMWDVAKIANTGRKDTDEVRGRKRAASRAGGRMLTLNGKTQCLTAWSEETRLALSTIFDRIRLGWNDEKVLTTPDRSTRFGISFQGETHTSSGWAKKLGLSDKAIKWRLKAGWPLEHALAAPRYSMHSAKLIHQPSIS
jgi:group I intron endonuclease